MFSPHLSPDHIAVDMRPVMVDFGMFHGMQNIYQKFPIPEMVQTILAVNKYNDYTEMLWFELERKFQGDLDIFDRDTLDLCFETLALHLDEYIGQVVPSAVDTSEYIFDKWVDPTTIILKRDENVSLYRDRGANDYIPNQGQYHLLNPRI